MPQVYQHFYNLSILIFIYNNKNISMNMYSINIVQLIECPEYKKLNFD